MLTGISGRLRCPIKEQRRGVHDGSIDFVHCRINAKIVKTGEEESGFQEPVRLKFASYVPSIQEPVWPKI